MSEENMNTNQKLLSDAEVQRRRNVANNANNVRLAADVAAKTDHPYAKAAGLAVKAADKLSDGKASEKLGKAMDNYMKTQGLKGKIMQAAMNKMSESGTSNRIAAAANKNNNSTKSSLGNLKSNGTGEKTTSSPSLDETPSQAEDASFNYSDKIVKGGLLACVFAMPILIIVCLFMSASQIYVKSIGLGSADSLSSEDAENKINKKEKDENNLNGEVGMDFFLEDNNSDSFRNSKLNEKNLVKIASTKYLKRKYNEADLAELEDFYPSVVDLSKNYDENMVYDFFFKMYRLHTNYRDKYNLEDGSQLILDLPLLMSTLIVQSDDMYEVFKYNLGSEDRKKRERTSYDEFDYEYDLSWYESTKKTSEHDMAILAQNMISKQVKEICKDSTGKEIKSNILKDTNIGTQSLVCGEGESYSTTAPFYDIDNEKYKMFLKQFLAEKYSLTEDVTKNLLVEIYDAKEQYEDLVGAYDKSELTIYDATSTSYWWPVGSAETNNVDGIIFANGDPQVTYITSNFGYRKDPLGRGRKFHSGVDIAGGKEGEVNIIAAKDGVVVYPTAKAKTDCPSSHSLSSCGGGYGNYVIIQHGDGNYTLYAHLYHNSITVKAGDSVKQGQVIGKMGSSGNSTGNHLHFEVREGSNSGSATVDPLNYISADNPRSVFTGDEFFKWLDSWEGHSPIEGQYYIVENIGDGVRTVGNGVTLEHNVGRFAAYGINIEDYPVGSKIEISIVDSIKLEEIASNRSVIENILSNNSITLKENEIQALISQKYNTGNISGFVDAYNKYGNTQSLYDNWFFRNIMKGTQFEKGLTRRRNAEWALFHAAKYVYNG